GELPQEDKYFTNVHNVLMVSNMTAIHAMEEKAKSFGIPSEILSDKMQGEAHTLGKKLISIAKDGSILLIGGETTHVVKGNGKGGRNQELVLSSLPYVGETVVISSFDSDGMDFTTFAGAIGDKLTVEKAKQKGLDPQVFLLNDDSTTFFQQIGDGIDTGKLESNVSDLMIVYKK
ncbi:MAG: MOFRL family protein, partial [Candidatus Levyibacteriota bacterium]